MTEGASGAEILAEIRELYRGDGVDLPSSTLYHHLGELESKGLVMRRERSRRTNDYMLSEAARKRVVDHREWVLGSTESHHTDRS